MPSKALSSCIFFFLTLSSTAFSNTVNWTSIFMEKIAPARDGKQLVTRFCRYKSRRWLKKNSHDIIKSIFFYDGELCLKEMPKDISDKKPDSLVFKGTKLRAYLFPSTHTYLNIFRLSTTFSDVPTYVATLELEEAVIEDKRFYAPLLICFIKRKANKWIASNAILPTNPGCTIHSEVTGITEISIGSRSFARIDFSSRMCNEKPHRTLRGPQWTEDFTVIAGIDDNMSIYEALKVQTGYSSIIPVASQPTPDGVIASSFTSIASEFDITSTLDLKIKQTKFETTRYETKDIDLQIKICPRTSTTTSTRVYRLNDDGITISTGTKQPWKHFGAPLTESITLPVTTSP